MKTKILPCPFCGGEAKLDVHGWPMILYCTQCGVFIKSHLGGEEGRNAVIERWNRRAGVKEGESWD